MANLGFLLVPLIILLMLASRTFGISQEYQRGVLFRLGRLGTKGPGWYWLIPLVTAAGAPIAAASPSNVQPVDLVGAFDQVIDEAAALPPAEQAARVQQRFATLLPGFYDARRLGKSPADYSQFLQRGIATYRATTRPGADRVRGRFNAMIGPAITDLERAVGPLPSGTKAYLVVSLGEFDGATRSLGDAKRETLLFGADMIAKYHGDSDARPFVQHELFHVYHGVRFPGCEQNWCSLWQEGLATHVAATLNPNASDADLLLNIPEPIRPELERNKAAAVCAVLARLDNAADSNALFSFKRLAPGLSPRFGYLVGEWVAADLGRTRSLAELAALKGPGLRAEIERSLRSMAICPAASP